MVGVFISHSWKKGEDEYDTLALAIKRWVREEVDDFTDNSVPEARRIGVFGWVPGILGLIVREKFVDRKFLFSSAMPIPRNGCNGNFIGP